MVPCPNLPVADEVGRSGIQWTYDPWRENARVAGLSAACALLLCVLVTSLREPLLVTAGLVLMCVAAFAPAITPAECRADERGVAIRGPLGWQRRPWSWIRRIEALPSAILLSPYPSRHLLDAQRGVTLPVPAARREELLALVRAAREAHERA